jgi:hypothetical protein
MRVAIGRRGDRSVPVDVGLVLLLLLLLGTWVAWAPAASAGEWVQVTCTQPDGAPAPIEGWTGSSYHGYGPDSGTIDTCAQSGGALTALDSSAAEEAAYTGPVWVYTAPGGSTIAGGVLKVALSTPQGQAYAATPIDEYSASDVFVNCQFNEPCDSATRTVSVANPGGTQLFMGAWCVGPYEGASTCPARSGGVNAEISMYAGDIELKNGSTPAGSAFAGSLLEPNASGTASLTFNAQDPEGPGVYRVIMDVDGAAAYEGTPDANGGSCASIGSYASGVSEFLYPQPCKRTVAVDVPFNTTKFANGQHRLTVTVQDAAGNTAVVYDGTISIANPNGAGSGGAAKSSIGPGSPIALRGAANGTNASDQAKLTARWKGTAMAVRTSAYGHADRITGRLTNSAGQPISGALLDISAIAADQNPRAASLASVTTGATGAWTLTLPKGIASSALRFAYRSHVNDTIPVATATLTLRVHAGIALHIAPHVAGVGHSIFFSGTLLGSPIPPIGKQVVLEASAGGEWIQFRSLSTNAKGYFRAFYRFKFPGPVTYRFRVVSPHESDFPFLEGTSNVVDVYER